jgi:hypothetical protein
LNKIKSDVNSNLNESIESNIKVYRFPKPKYDCFSEYLKYGGSINYDVWQKMYDWRLKCAKDRDIRLNRFLSIEFFAKVCTDLPQNNSDLFKSLPFARAWHGSLIVSLLQVIKGIKKDEQRSSESVEKEDWEVITPQKEVKDDWVMDESECL